MINTALLITGMLQVNKIKNKHIQHDKSQCLKILISDFIYFRHGSTDEMCNYHIHYAYPAGSNDLVRHVECAWDAETFHWKDHFPNIPQNSSNTEDTDQTYYINKFHWTRHNY